MPGREHRGPAFDEGALSELIDGMELSGGGDTRNLKTDEFQSNIQSYRQSHDGIRCWAGPVQLGQQNREAILGHGDY